MALSATPVQSKTANSGAGTTNTLTLTLDSAPTAGNVVVVSAGGNGGADVSATNITWIYRQQFSISASPPVVSLLAVGIVQSSPGSVLTITSATAIGISGVAAEFTGNNLRPDQWAGATSGAGATTSPSTGTTTTTGAADELCVASLVARNNVTFSSPTNSFSIVGQDKSTNASTTDRSTALLVRLASSTGTYGTGATIGTASICCGQILTLREIVSGGVSRGRMI